jgi:sulfane dehydrogenase subunit SoxC
VVDQPYMAMMETTRYPSLRPDGKSRWFESEHGPKSVITRPSGGQKLPGPGFHEITGLAWSGGGSVRRVEVSTDGGRTWKDAQLQEPIARKAHTRFRMDWNWDGTEVVLQSRCTDDRREVQPTLAELAKIWGVNMDYFPRSCQSRHRKRRRHKTTSSSSKTSSTNCAAAYPQANNVTCR